MNKQELQQRINEVKQKITPLLNKHKDDDFIDVRTAKQLAEIIFKLLEEKQEPKMFPQNGDEYWSFSAYGNVSSATARDSNGRILVYRTKEEAERARDIEVAKTKLKHIIEVANDGWTPDWSDEGRSSKISFTLMNNKLIIEELLFTKGKPNWMYMKSREIAEDILAKHRDLVEIVEGE